MSTRLDGVKTVDTGLCKVVYGSAAEGYVDRSQAQTYAECLAYLKAHRDELADVDSDPHYTPGLDIMSVDTGRLMSWGWTD